jgi:hypothetical protein
LLWHSIQVAGAPAGGPARGDVGEGRGESWGRDCTHGAYEATRERVGLGYPVERCLAYTGWSDEDGTAARCRCHSIRVSTTS